MFKLFKLLILIFLIKSCMASKHLFGKRHSGDKLIETKELINRQSPMPVRYIIKYNHMDNRPISALEYDIENTESTSIIGYTDNDAVNATINAEPTDNIRGVLYIYGYDKLIEAPVDFKSLFRVPPPMVIKRLVKYNVMHKNIQDDMNGIRHIRFGERQSNDRLLNFTMYHASRVKSWEPFTITYNGTGSITYVEFDFPSLSTDLIGFIPTETYFQTVAYDPGQHVQEANVTVYGYPENHVPSYYTPIMRLQNIEHFPAQEMMPMKFTSSSSDINNDDDVGTISN